MDLKRWLARYKPEQVRCTCADKSTKLIKVPSHSKRWAAVYATVATYDAVKVEALDGEGGVIHAVDLERDPVDEDAGDDDKKQKGTMAVVLPIFAKCLTEACDQAVSRHADVWTKAFDTQYELTKLLLDRVNGLERAYHKLFFASHDGAAAGDVDGMAMTFLGQAFQNKMHEHQQQQQQQASSKQHKNGASDKGTGQ
jgi:hypothetical protein